MAAGVQCWNDQGVMTLDLSFNLVKFLGTVGIGNSYTGDAASGSIYDNRFTAYPGCQPWFQIINAGYPSIFFPSITIFGDSLNWNFPRSSNLGAHTRPDLIIAYGIE